MDLATTRQDEAALHSTRLTLGVVTISYNEEEDLPGFLDHLLRFVDEIVILDDGSTDATGAIAEAAGEKVRFLVSPRSKGEYFSHQRNKGIDAAQSDWLLHMDIDERVPPALAREIRAAIADPARDAYRLRRVNYFMHRPMKGGGWPDWCQVHLARRGVLRFAGMFHEDCLVDVPQERIGSLATRILHFNENAFPKRLAKSDRYLEEVCAHLRRRRGRIGSDTIAAAFLREFVKRYILKLGFRDGTPGLISALHSATAQFRAHALVWDERNRRSRAELEAEVDRLWRLVTPDD
jgi:glycosyltransferase involved in cell wall biosynthesis